MCEEDVLSRTISWLRFPMIAGVVLLHVDIPIDESANLLFGLFKYILVYGLSNLAVPLFFMISGFLFFYKTSFSLTAYMAKLKRRLRSLLIPFLFWNLAYMAVIYFIQCVAPSMLGGRKMISDYSAIEFINSFWNYSGYGPGCPILAPTWFLRDLIVMVIVSPILYALIKYSRGFFVLLLAVCYVLGVNIGVVGFSRSWLFFSFGAYMSIFGYNPVVVFRKYAEIIIPFSLLFLVVLISLQEKGLLYRMYIIVGVCAVLALMSKWVTRTNFKQWPILSESSFFVYLFHGFYIVPLSAFYCHIVPLNAFTGVIGFFFITFFACVIAVLAYKLVKYCSPKLCAFVTGGR